MTEIASYNDLKAKDQSHHIHTSTNPVAFSKTGPQLITRAKGIRLFRDDGKEIIDAGSGLSNVNIGYGNQQICDAVYQAMQQLSFGQVSEGRGNPWSAALSAKLAEITPDNFQHFLFSTIGSDAIESAFKMAWHYWRLKGQPNKRAIISRRHSYHGNTVMAISVSGISAYQKQFGLPLDGVANLIDPPYWYRYGREQTPEQFGVVAAAWLEERILELGAENVAAFVGEPVVQTGEMFVPPSTYWPEIRRICDKYDVLLIADEIITGFGKTGRMFGFENFDFEPDLLVLAKGITSGYFPLSTVAVNCKVSDVTQRDDEMYGHIFTNCGHPVGAAAALANIAVIEEQGLVDKVRLETGPYLAQRMQEFLSFPFVGEVRSIGLMAAIEIDTSKDQAFSHLSNEEMEDWINELAWEKGLTMRASGLVLPLIVTKADIDQIIDILKVTIAEVAAQ